MKYEMSKGYLDSAEDIYFQNKTGHAVQERLKKDDVILIPIGSTEYHGMGQAYGEDGFLVTRMAEIVAKKCGCTVSQPIWFGSHPWNQLGMPGTIVVPEDTFTDYLRAVIAGYWNAGFRKMILLNGHGQEYVIPNAIHTFEKKTQVPAMIALSTGPPSSQSTCAPRNTAARLKHRSAMRRGRGSYAMALFPELNHKSGWRTPRTGPRSTCARPVRSTSAAMSISGLCPDIAPAALAHWRSSSTPRAVSAIRRAWPTRPRRRKAWKFCSISSATCTTRCWRPIPPASCRWI